MMYDALGRMTSKSDAGGTADWKYDVPSVGIGRVAAMASASDARLAGECTIPFIPGTAKRAGRSFKYTAFGQVEEVSECVDGVTFTTNYTYDTAARQSVVTYPDVERHQAGREAPLHQHRLPALHHR